MAMRQGIDRTLEGATDTTGILYNPAGIELERDSSSGVYPDFLISRSLTAGVYCVQVQGDSSDTIGRYQFRVEGNFINCPAAKCGGVNVTICGTEGDDVLLGTAGNDVMAGFGGDDTLYGLDGNDILCGGAGDDVLIGGNGNDRLFGDNDHDVLLGEAGRDSLNGGSGDDILHGGTGTDACNEGTDLTGDIGHASCETKLNIP